MPIIAKLSQLSQKAQKKFKLLHKILVKSTGEFRVRLADVEISFGGFGRLGNVRGRCNFTSVDAFARQAHF